MLDLRNTIMAAGFATATSTERPLRESKCAQAGMPCRYRTLQLFSGSGDFAREWNRCRNRSGTNAFGARVLHSLLPEKSFGNWRGNIRRSTRRGGD
jgi:hypothetical protein